MKFLQNLSYKTLFTILFLALAGIVFFLKIGGKTTKVSAGWWNDSWHYRQAINISSHTALESNVYITTSINIGTTTKAQIDDGDFRFISQSGENLSYYIVSGAGTTNVSFHILIPSFPSGTSTIYAYYGNSTIQNGFSSADFSTEASNYTIGSLSSEEGGGGPIAYWKFDEGVGTTAYDSSNNKLNANLINSKWQTGISGSAFDGSSGGYISIPDNNIFDISDNLTISFWYYPRSTHTNYANHPIQKWTGTSDANFVFYEFGNSGSGNTYMWYANRGGVWGNISDTWAPSTLNKWYFVSLIYNSTTGGQLYIDGKAIGTKKGSGLLATNNATFNVLNDTSSSQPSIDELKIYPYIRTADQIKQDYNSRGTLSGSSANLGVQSSTAPDLNSSLIAHYKLNEGSGISVNSSIGNYTGSIGGTSPAWSNNCQSGKCVNFNSNNINNILTNVSYNNSSEYTISAYIYPTSLAGSQFKTILGSVIGNNLNSGLVLEPNGADICYHNYYGTGDINYCSSNNPITLNKWQYVALTFKNNDVNVFYNGINVKNVSVGKTNTSASTIIGGPSSDGYTGARFFDGLIDEVKIYNKALTPDEIKQDYNGSSAIQFGSTNQTIGGTTTSLDYCIPGDTTYCAPPIAEWKMDEGVGTSIIDTSGNSNNGTFGAGSSAPTWTQGKIGKGLSFNGTSNFINIGNSSPFNNLSTISISLWAKPNSISGCQTLVSKANSAGFGIELGCATSGKWNWSPHINGSYRNAISDNIANTSSWTHIEGIYDGNIVKLYINGSLQSTSVAVNGTITNNAVDVLFGENPPTDGSFFNGTLDQVRIYNYARTPAQVAYDYNRGGPIGWWKMDECQGSTIYDWSGNGNNGTLTIGSSGSQNSIGTCQIGTSAAWTNGATGKFNSSLNFDGIDDTILIGNPTTVQIEQGDFSVSTWLKPSLSKCGMEGIAKSGNIMCGTATAGGWALGSTSDYKFRFRVSDSTNVLYKDAVDTNIYSLNTWYHVVGIKKNNTIYLYVNNKLVASNDITGLTIDTNKNLYIGGRTIGYWLWPGQIDDVRIYNYALTPEQIKQIYNGGAISFN